MNGHVQVEDASEGTVTYCNPPATPTKAGVFRVDSATAVGIYIYIYIYIYITLLLLVLALLLHTLTIAIGSGVTRNEASREETSNSQSVQLLLFVL
jgi:hypothetical protein